MMLPYVCGAKLTRTSTREWQPCAVEGEAIPDAATVRFGFGMSWVEGQLPSGASCSVAAFGSDPTPGIRKVCECLPDSNGNSFMDRNDFGVKWSRCAAEGENCQCSTTIRFGAGLRWNAVDAKQVRAAVTRADPDADQNEPVACEAESFGGDDPAPGSKKECWCEQSHAPLPQEKVAIVMLSRHPPDVNSWLKYHLNYMKVDHIFMEVEDTPAFDTIWNSLPSDIQQKVTVTKAPPTGTATDSRPRDDYETLQARQVKAMQLARDNARRLGIQWLIHIDDDELLYTPLQRPIGQILGSMPDGFDQAYIPNVEAVYPSAEIKSCFTETHQANVNRYKFVSYANGKAAVRLANPVLFPAGPHQWRTTGNLEPNSIHLDQEPFGAPMMVVHYESCPFSRWEDKFWELGNTPPEKVSKIPFPFYKDSINTMQHCRPSKGGKPAFVALRTDKRARCNEASLRKFWENHKSIKNPKLARADYMTINIPWSQILGLGQ